MKDSLSVYCCPKCYFKATEQSLIRTKNLKYNRAKYLEFGGLPYDWTEIHLCPNCNVEFEFENSNC